MVGSRDKLQRVLNGTSLDDVINTGKDPAYHLMRLGQLDLSKVHPARVPLIAGIDNQVMKIHPLALPNVENAIVPLRKLTEYSLNPNHTTGGSDKARVFAALGFNQGNAQLLADQISEAVLHHPAVKQETTPHGEKFAVNVPVVGPVGIGVVRTGWILKTGETSPRMTTAYVLKEKRV